MTLGRFYLAAITLVALTTLMTFGLCGRSCADASADASATVSKSGLNWDWSYAWYWDSTTGDDDSGGTTSAYISNTVTSGHRPDPKDGSSTWRLVVTAPVLPAFSLDMYVYLWTDAYCDELWEDAYGDAVFHYDSNFSYSAREASVPWGDSQFEDHGTGSGHITGVDTGFTSTLTVSAHASLTGI